MKNSITTGFEPLKPYLENKLNIRSIQYRLHHAKMHLFNDLISLPENELTVLSNKYPSLNDVFHIIQLYKKYYPCLDDMYPLLGITAG